MMELLSVTTLYAQKTKLSSKKSVQGSSLVIIVKFKIILQYVVNLFLNFDRTKFESTKINIFFVTYFYIKTRNSSHS